MKIASLITYCTNEYRFIKHCIDHAKPFSDQIIVSSSDCFFDGEKENSELLDKTYQENSAAEFIESEWTPGHDVRYWCNMARYVGSQQLHDDIDWVVLLDSDEIFDTELFMDFLNTTDFRHVSYKLANYYYFREPIYQSVQWEDSIVLCQRRVFNVDVTHPYHERGQYSEMLVNEPVLRHVTHSNGLPMIHHYSWVRTREQMLKKVQKWWHSPDRPDWTQLVEEEFTHPFTGKDFLHPYEYKTVENKWNI